MAKEELSIIISAKDKASRTINGIEGALGKLGRIGAGVALGGIGALTVGTVALGGALAGAIKLADEQAGVERQLDTVLKSTGFAANLTAQEIKRMASEMQSLTTFGDEQIIAGQNLLLTFKEIGRDVFPDATKTMLDMSVALGQDMKSSAIQLGKALNDPLTGVSALQRVGVSFTEQQKEQIKAMVEAGDVASAQRLILDELASQFGGSAEAAAEGAGRFTQIKNVLGDMAEDIGGIFLPTLARLAEQALPAVMQAAELLEGAAPIFEIAFGTLLDGEVEKAIQVIGLGLQQLGIPPEVVEKITSFLDNTRIKFNELTTAADNFITQTQAGLQVIDAETAAETAEAYERLGAAWGDFAEALGITIPDMAQGNIILQTWADITTGWIESLNFISAALETISGWIEDLQSIDFSIGGILSRLGGTVFDQGAGPDFSAASIGQPQAGGFPGPININMDGQLVGNIVGGHQGAQARGLAALGGQVNQ